MRKLLALLLALVMALGCMACFAGCNNGSVANAVLDEAATYLNNLYKDEAKSTPKDYDVAGKILIGTIEFTVTWKTDSDKVTIKESKTAGFYTVDVPDENAKEFEYTLTATVKDAEGNTKDVTFKRSVPVLEKVVVDSTKKVVLQLTDTDKDGKAVTKYVTGTHYLYTSSSGSQKWELALTTDKAEALAMVVVENENGTVSFMAEEKYLYSDATHVKFVDEAGEYTEFVLETVEGGSFIKCANATYGEAKKPQYLEMYSGYLTVYGAPSDETKNFMYTFTLADAGEAAGKITVPTETPDDPDDPKDPVTPPATLDAVTAPEAGVAYKLFLTQASVGKNLFAIGDTQNQEGKFVLTTETAADAPDFYVEAVDGGFKFYTTINDAKMYLHAKHTTEDGEKYSKYLCYAETTDVVWTYDAEVNAWCTTIEGREYAMGTYGTYTTFSISDKSFFEDEEKAKNQYPGQLVLKENAENYVPDTPDDPGNTDTPTLNTPEEIVNAAYALGLGETLGTQTLTGVVTEVNTAYNEQFKNVTFTIVVGEMTDKPIECFRVKGDAAATVKAGDTVTVTGELLNYASYDKDTGEFKYSKVEFNAGATFVIDVVADGGDDTPGDDTPAQEYTIVDALALEVGTKLIVSGTVTEFYRPWSDQYGNVSVYISDDAGNKLLCYNLTTKVEKGDIIKVTGEMGEYNGAKQVINATVEITGKAEVDGPVEMSIADALAAEDGTSVIVTGTVTEIKYAWSDSSANMSVNITDDAGNTLYIYKLATKVVMGDVIKVTGDMATYKESRQIAAGATAVIVTAHTCTTFDDATCTAAKTCTVCGATEGDALGHTYVDGACSVCGAAEPAGDTITASKTIADLIVSEGWTNTTTKQSFTLDDNVSVKIDGGNNTGKAYNGDHIRIYATDTPAGTMTISVAEGYELVSVKVTTQTGTYAFLCVGDSTDDISNVSTAVSGSSVVLNSVKNGSNGKQVRVTAIEVVYKVAA
jgi:DNA/RNA endonuclease YhcR with UshA esterase domain